MRYILFAMLLLGLMAAPSLVHASECKTITVSALVAKAMPSKPVLMQAKPYGLAKLLVFVNKNRAKQGTEPIDADLFIFAMFPNGKIGIAFAKDGCAVAGMVHVIDAATLSQIMTGAGVTGADIEAAKEGVGA